MGLNSPDKIRDNEYRFDAFSNGKVLLNKKKNRLPVMGWNSWNAFGTGNNEKLTKAIADCLVSLGLDKLGYKYVVLDDGCYKSKRSDDGKLENDEVKFPGAFSALADYIHSKGLKFGMYNDIGTKLCSGLEVGTCGHEKTDAASYVDWKIDFLKVDNCYYLWDNATFSDPKNAKYVFAPFIKEVEIKGCDITGQKIIAARKVAAAPDVRFSDVARQALPVKTPAHCRRVQQRGAGLQRGPQRFAVKQAACRRYRRHVDPFQLFQGPLLRPLVQPGALFDPVPHGVL